ncbi:MAG: precorrin-4 C(11)-methyltransferase [Nitrospirae bacterium]|nr:precorrin-4 C(11)-methyltransferase [Nitrospirota bacterium]
MTVNGLTAVEGKGQSKGKVYFVGAGPGDPDLITIKGRRLLDGADTVIYAGSLVNTALLEGVRAALYDSASMALDDLVALMESETSLGKIVVRLHTGDTAFYSAITEQIERLATLGIDSETVPGVSSLSAALATLGQEFTIPEVSQTVIITRRAGRTPVPEKESLAALASHGASMAIFLSVSMIESIVGELRAGYGEDTPVAVIEKASWPQERILRGTLADIASKVREAGVTKTAIILVGESLRASIGGCGKESRLYDKDFRHGYRK